MAIPWLMKSGRMSFIIVWNVAGELQRLKKITWGSYSPCFVANTAFHLSPSWIWTLLKSHWRSSPCHWMLYRQTQYVVMIAIAHQSLPFSDLIQFVFQMDITSSYFHDFPCFSFL